ncbi:MAG: hypothetical protein ACRDGE_06045 [Candidatus Limnocylindria bacterium]
MSGEQISAEQLKTMSPDAIVKARKEGRLQDVLAGEPPTPEPPQASADQGARGPRYASERERLRSMSPREIVEERKRGDLDGQLDGSQR